VGRRRRSSSAQANIAYRLTGTMINKLWTSAESSALCRCVVVESPRVVGGDGLVEEGLPVVAFGELFAADLWSDDGSGWRGFPTPRRPGQRAVLAS
jgi:hypothetical protein